MEIRINMQSRSNRHILRAVDILSYLIGNNEKIETLVICKPNNLELITTDQDLYEALGCIKPYDEFKLNKLTKLLEVTDVISQKYANRKQKTILKDERVEELRKLVLRNGGNQND